MITNHHQYKYQVTKMVITVLVLIGYSFPIQIDSTFNKNNSDEGWARAMMGAVPVFSGMYMSKQPATGLIFTAMDVAFIAGIWSHRDKQQTENAVDIYWGFLIATNVLDAIVSYRIWDEQRIPKTTLGWNPIQGVTAKAIWNF